MESMSFAVPGNLGNIEGPNADGVLIGEGTMDDPSAVIVKAKAFAGLCITDDGGTYAIETTPFNESTGDDVEIMTTAVEDANYFGHATLEFDELALVITTQGAGTWTVTWEYWDGSAWTALSGVTDGTTGFTAAAATVAVTFTKPTDWAKCTVDGVNAYWVRARCSAFTSSTTQCQLGQGWIVSSDFSYVDETTDATDAGTGDFELVSSYPAVGDALFFLHSERFCKIKLTYSTAAAGTFTVTPKYWDGSAWQALTVVDDDSSGYTATAGTHLIHFSPPSDWVANNAGNGPNGEAGYCVALEVTAFTSLSTQGLGTQAWVLPLKTGMSGPKSPVGVSSVKVDLTAGTKSATNADSVLLLVNATQGTSKEMTWTKGDPHVAIAGTSFAVAENDELAVVQVTEDGTTEFADANIVVHLGS